MDVVLHAADKYVLDGLWSRVQPEWGRDHLVRQSVSVSRATHSPMRVHNRPLAKLLHASNLQLYTLTMLGVLILYFGIAGGSYYLMCKWRDFG